MPTEVGKCDSRGLAHGVTGPQHGPCIFSARFFPRNTGVLFCCCPSKSLVSFVTPTPA